jgi:hypothetical protein
MDKLRKLQHRRHHRTDDPRACAYCTEAFTPNKPTNSEFCCWNCRCGHQNFHRRNRNLPPDVVASKFEKLQQKRQMRAFLADLNMTLDWTMTLEAEMAKCGICSHPEREAIERTLQSGTLIRSVLERYGIEPANGSPALHFTKHIPERERLETEAANVPDW